MGDDVQRKSDAIGIINLPNELISHILCLGLPHFETNWLFTQFDTAIAIRSYRLRILLVCRVWTNIAMSTPLLWTFFFWRWVDWQRDRSEALPILRSHLERSRNLRMWILLDDPTWYDEGRRGASLPDFKEVVYERRDCIHALALRYPKGLEGWPYTELSDPMPHLQILSIYTGSGTLFEDAPRNIKTKQIRDLELAACDYMDYYDLIEKCVELQCLSLRNCTFNLQPLLPVSVQRVQFFGHIEAVYDSASIYAQAVVHFEVELLRYDNGYRFGDTVLPTFSNLASVRVRLPREGHLTVIVDLLARSPMLRYVEILLDEETINVEHLYGAFMKKQGWDELRTHDSSEPHSDDTDTSSREPQAPLLRFLRIGVVCYHGCDPTMHDLSVLKSLLLLRPLLQMQFMLLNGSSAKLYDEHMEICKEFPGRVEMLKIEETGVEIPTLADITAHDSLGDLSR